VTRSNPILAKNRISCCRLWRFWSCPPCPKIVPAPLILFMIKFDDAFVVSFLAIALIFCNWNTASKFVKHSVFFNKVCFRSCLLKHIIIVHYLCSFLPSYQSQNSHFNLGKRYFSAPSDETETHASNFLNQGWFARERRTLVPAGRRHWIS